MAPSLAGISDSFELARVGPKAKAVGIGAGFPLLLIAGPCVIESEQSILRHAEFLAKATARLGIPLVFKSSFDKANRTAIKSFRGLGIDEGLRILSKVRSELGLPVITDVHSPEDAAAAAQAVDILQIPAFLCRQTDLLLAAAATKKAVMVKKGQMVSPEDMVHVAEKIVASGNNRVVLCERGACFGYRDLVVDFRSLDIMSSVGCPVVFDATHSVQIMGGTSGRSSGNRHYVPLLARAAVAAGADGVFIECHENPDNAPSDGPNMLPLDQLEIVLEDLVKLARLELKSRRRKVIAEASLT